MGSATKTIPYTYSDTNWKDKLTSYNGQAITYDAIGNPLSYRGNTLTWQNGRQLATLNGNGTAASYKYDANGLRTEKTVNGVKTVYYYVGDELVYEKRGANTELYYFYDESGSLSGIRYILNGQVSDCVVATNWRGDVEALYDLNGNQVAQYIYDAWGNQISIKKTNGTEITDPTHIATVNPFRYRGYYLDTETNLYYLQSRYYDAETHRFINADIYAHTGNNLVGGNAFNYTYNNPVNNFDPSGTMTVKNALIATGIGMVAVGAVVGIAALTVATGGVGTLALVTGTTITASTSAAAYSVAAAAFGSAAVGSASAVAGIVLPEPSNFTFRKVSQPKTLPGDSNSKPHSGTKNGKKSEDKHTKPRSGRSNDKKRVKDNWNPNPNKKKGPNFFAGPLLQDFGNHKNNGIGTGGSKFSGGGTF